MIPQNFVVNSHFTRWVSPLRGGLHTLLGAWWCCLAAASGFAATPGVDALYRRNSLECNDHSKELRLALYTIFHGLQVIESRSPLPL